MQVGESFLSVQGVEFLGWLLVHFVWQGALIASLLAVALACLRRSSADARYSVACSALLLMAACPAITGWILYQNTTFKISLLDATVTLPPVESIDSNKQKTEPTSSNIQPPLNSPTNEFTKSTSVSIAFPLLPWPEGFAGPLKPLIPWLVSAWIMGVLTLSARLLSGWLQVQRLRKQIVPLVSEEWQSKLRSLVKKLRISQPVRLVESAFVEVPTVIGWFRPMILLPASALTGLTPQQLEALLAHELAHVRRHDYVVNLTQAVIETLLFYHPAIWWVSNRIRNERENCCDDWAVRICGDRVAYAHALVALEELRAPAYGLAMTANGGSLLSRIRRLVNNPTPHANLTTWWLAGVFALATVATLSAGVFMSSHANEQNPSNKKELLAQIDKPKLLEVAPDQLALAPTDQPANPQGAATEKVLIPKDAKTKEAISQGIEFLKKKRLENGLWTEFGGAQDGGVTALVLHALLQAGVPANDESVKIAMKSLLNAEKGQSTYVTSLKILALCASKNAENAPIVQGYVDWLEKAQSKAAPSIGGWRYTQAGGSDGSNTRFAVLALHAAAKADYKVSPETWQRAANYFANEQNEDGSWGYVGGTNGTMSMTYAGVAGLAIVNEYLPADDETKTRIAAWKKGLQWISRHNPENRPTGWEFYIAHCLERAGSLTRVQKIGDWNWRTEQTKNLIEQQKNDGSWNSGTATENPIISTSLALIALTGQPEPVKEEAK